MIEARRGQPACFNPLGSSFSESMQCNCGDDDGVCKFTMVCVLSSFVGHKSQRTMVTAHGQVECSAAQQKRWNCALRVVAEIEVSRFLINSTLC